MITNPTIQDSSASQLLTGVCQELSTLLQAQLTWLTNSYGKADRLVNIVDNKRFFYPAVYIGNNTDRNNQLDKDDYLKLFPDSHLGNFSFWGFPGEEMIKEWDYRATGPVETEFTLVIWFNLNDIASTSNIKYHGLDDIKAEVLNALRAMRPKKSKFKITEVYERTDSIWRYYSSFLESIGTDNVIREASQQFLMHPYAGLGFKGSMIYDFSTC